MRTHLAVSAILFMLAGFALGQGAPKGAPPVLKIVANVDKDKGQIVIVETVTRLVPVQKVIEVIENGQTIRKTVTEYVTVAEQRMVVTNVANSRVITPDGKQLPIDEVWKRVKKDTVMAFSTDGTTPGGAYLAALREDTLILIPEMPKIPVPAPVPERKPEKK